jgi:hypothetical protein
MATTDWGQVQVWQVSKPNTLRALQHTFVAATKAIKSKGKRGLFGADKEHDALRKAVSSIQDALQAMEEDGLDASFTRLRLEVAQFAIAFPNWPNERDFLDDLLEKLES